GDAEVIALAVESLRAAGVPGTTIRLGHLGLLNDLLRELPEGLQADVRARLYRREFVGIGNAALDGPPARLLRALAELHGLDGLGRAREFATSPTSRGAVGELGGVAGQLRAYGVAGGDGHGLAGRPAMGRGLRRHKGGARRERGDVALRRHDASRKSDHPKPASDLAHSTV